MMALMILNGLWNKKLTALQEALAVEKTLTHEDHSYLGEWRKNRHQRSKKYEPRSYYERDPSTYSLHGSLSTRSSSSYYEVQLFFLANIERLWENLIDKPGSSS